MEKVQVPPIELQRKRRGTLIRKELLVIQNRNKFEDVYKLKHKKRPLGTGGFGVVYHCKHLQSGQRRAVKVLKRKSIVDMDEFRQEIYILQKVDHPHILRIYEYFVEEDHVYIVTEVCNGGELHTRILDNKGFSEKDAAIIFQQILKALNYLHSKGITHRDVKPENFLFSSKDQTSLDLKMIDFGLSKVVNTYTMTANEAQNASDKRAKMVEMEKQTSKAGTPLYLAPEVIVGSYDGFQADMWAAGCVLYVILSGTTPFYGQNDIEIKQNILNGDMAGYDSKSWNSISKEGIKLINQLISKPAKRLTAEKALDHKWFKNMLEQPAQRSSLGSRQLRNVSDFAEQNEIKQTAISMISVNVSPDEISDLKELFLSMDKNGDGTLSISELEEGFKGKPNAAQLLEMLKAADTDESGEIDYTEFIAATIDRNIYQNKKYLKQAFDSFDADGSGKIDKEEMKALLGGHGIDNIVPVEAIAAALAEIDKDGDGEIDFDEFMEMMMGAAAK